MQTDIGLSHTFKDEYRRLTRKENFKSKFEVQGRKSKRLQVQ
jgi:hypothetical protein